ncbi:hypothetical protein ACFY4K_35465 [Streptomyces leeuwenhoekii]
MSPSERTLSSARSAWSSTASTPAASALRPLRDPDALELDEDDDADTE